MCAGATMVSQQCVRQFPVPHRRTVSIGPYQEGVVILNAWSQILETLWWMAERIIQAPHPQDQIQKVGAEFSNLYSNCYKFK